MLVVLHTCPTKLEVPDNCDIVVTCRSGLVPILRLVAGMTSMSDLVSSRHRVFFHGNPLQLDGTQTAQDVYDLAVQALPLDTITVADDAYDLSLVRVHKLPPTYTVVSCDSTFDSVDDCAIVPFVHFVRWMMGKTLVRTPGCVVPPFEADDRPVFLYGGGQNAMQTFGSYAAYANLTGHLAAKHTLAGASMGAVVAASYVSVGDVGVVYDRFVEAVHQLAGHKADKSCIESALRLMLGDRSHETFEDLFKRTQQRLDVLVTDVKTCKPCVYNYVTKPHVRVLDAVLASCSIPLVIGLHRIDGQLLCDGELYAHEYIPAVSCVIDYTSTRSAVQHVFSGPMFETFRSASSPFASVMAAVRKMTDSYVAARANVSHPKLVKVPMDMSLFTEITADFADASRHVANYAHGFTWILEHLQASPDS